MKSFWKDFLDRAIHQPVLLFGLLNLGFLAAFPDASTGLQVFVNGVVILLQKMYSTSSANLAEEKANSYNAALADVDTLAAAEIKPIELPQVPND